MARGPSGALRLRPSSAFAAGMDGPKTIRTDRLLLRPMRARDAIFMVRLLGNRDTRRYLGGPVPMGDRLRRVRDQVRAGPDADLWVATLNDAKTLVGVVDVSLHKEGRDHEVSYQFYPTFWSRGLAFEAVGAVIDHTLGPRGMPRIIAETQSANIASCRLLTRLGMTEQTRVHRFGAEQIIYGTGPGVRLHPPPDEG